MQCISAQAYVRAARDPTEIVSLGNVERQYGRSEFRTGDNFLGIDSVRGGTNGVYIKGNREQEKNSNRMGIHGFMYSFCRHRGLHESGHRPKRLALQDAWDH